MRGKPERFAEHYNQAQLFWNSQSPVEKAHIIRAFRFELTKVQTAAIRERVVSMLANVADELAEGVAEGLGLPELPEPMPKLLPRAPKPEVTVSPALSLFARPGNDGIKTRKVAILVADGVDGQAALAIHEGLAGQGAVPRFVGVTLGAVESVSGDALTVEVTMEASSAVIWDALIIPGGEESVATLIGTGHAREFLRDQYRHCKTILLLGAASGLLDQLAIPRALPDGKPDPGLLVHDASDTEAAIQAFSAALSLHRHWERETDPPLV